MNTDSRTVKIKMLNNDAVLPTRGTEYSAGYDLYAIEDAIIESHTTVKIGTGIAAEIPCGYFGGIFARSGLAVKYCLRPGNCVGIVDSDFRGEIIVALHNDGDKPQIVHKGERIAQLVIIPYQAVRFEVVDRLDETDRGDGGFGSTGV